MHRLALWLALASAALVSSAAAQPAADSSQSAPPDTTSQAGLADLADSLRTAVPVAADSVRELEGRAAASLDSAAVAALADTTATLAEALGEGTDVRLFGKTLFQIYGGLGDVSLERRTERLSARLEDLARNRDVDPARLRVVDGNDLTTILVDDVILMSVTDDDARALGRSRPDAAVQYREAIVAAVVAYREQATLRGVLEGIAKSAAAFLLLLLTLRGLRGAYAWLGRRTAVLRGQLVRPVRIGTLEVVGRDQVAGAGRLVSRLSRLAVSLVFVYIFLTFAFGQFAWTQSWSENLLEAALSPLRSLGALLVASVDNVIAILVILAVVRWIIRLSDYLFLRVARGEAEIGGFHAELADPTRKITKFILVVMGAMLIYPYTPIADNRGFQGLTVFFGLLLSLGSSTAISNMVAGVVLTYTRAFRVGDRVRVGETFGDVVEKSFLVTRVRTPKNEDVSVPNANVLSGFIVNYSRMAREGSGVILHTEVTIGYDVPWPTVHQVMRQAALDTAGVEAEPAPFVLQKGLGDFSVAYELNAYTREVTRMARLYSDLHQHMQDRFAEAGIEILSPTYEAHRDGPSTLPDLGALHDAHARAEVRPEAKATDGADVAEPEAVDLAPLPPPPTLLGTLGRGRLSAPTGDPDGPGDDRPA